MNFVTDATESAEPVCIKVVGVVVGFVPVVVLVTVDPDEIFAKSAPVVSTVIEVLLENFLLG